MAVAVVLLIGGLWEGLASLGLPLAASQHSLHVDHGPLMVLGFLGTLIALERAVTLEPATAYVAPAGAASGGPAVTCSAPNGVGQGLVTGDVILVAIFAAVYRIQAGVQTWCWPAARCAGWLPAHCGSRPGTFPGSSRGCPGSSC